MAQQANRYHFVVSAPRSGSTWLARAIGRHEQVHATENRLFGEFCDMWKNQRGQPTPRITFDTYAEAFSRHSFSEGEKKEFQSEFVSAYLEFLATFLRSHSGKSVIVDKVTPYLGTSKTVLDKIRVHFPDSKLIFLVRDGRDVMTSGVFDGIRHDAKDSKRYRRFVENQIDQEVDRFFDDESISNWARHWSEVFEIFHNDADLVIRYEDMISNQPTELQKIFQMLDVSDDFETCKAIADSVSFKETTGRERGDMDPLAKARNAVVADWKNYLTISDARLFDKFAGETLVAASYESGRNWLDHCPASLELFSSDAID